MNYHKQLETAFKQTLKLRGSTAEISGEQFQFIRGRFISELDGQEFAEATGLHLNDPLNTFSTSTLRCQFPEALLLDSGRVAFKNGTILDCITDGTKYHVEAINDNPESPWIKIFLTEV